MGTNIKLLRIMLIILSSLLAATVTAFAGPISFVGIAVPHLVKGMTGTTSPPVMIPGCFLTGALITLFCDCVARTVFAPTEVSISSVTAVLLVPVVISMLLGKHVKDRG
jgi:iron complex transport system permease protein